MGPSKQFTGTNNTVLSSGNWRYKRAWICLFLFVQSMMLCWHVVAKAELSPVSGLSTLIGDMHVSYDLDESTGNIVSLQVADGAFPQPYNGTSTRKPSDAARQFLVEYGVYFGLLGSELEDVGLISQANSLQSVRFRQTKNNRPVYGSGLIVRMNESAEVTGVTARASSADTPMDVATVSKSDAILQGRILVAVEYPAISEESWQVRKAELLIFNPYLINVGRDIEHLAWHVEIVGHSMPGFSYHIFTDARTGNILASFGGASDPNDGGGGEVKPPLPVDPLISPVGDLVGADRAFPMFSWVAEGAATRYQLYVAKIGVSVEFGHLIKNVSAIDACGEDVEQGICSTIVSGDVADGAGYRWWVGAANDSSVGDVYTWSDPRVFRFFYKSSLPEGLTEGDLLKPAGGSEDVGVEFSWVNKGNATWFRVMTTVQETGLQAGTRLWVSAVDAQCASAGKAICSVSYSDHLGKSDSESYCWNVTPYNSAGMGGRSPDTCFFKKPQ